jgi:hypothetical protein
MQREKKKKGKEKKSSQTGTHWLPDAGVGAFGSSLQSRIDDVQAICDALVLSEQTVVAKMIIQPIQQMSRP